MSQQALPPSWQHVGRHAVFPESAHDDTARFDFLANLNGYLATQLSPKVKLAYEQRVKPAFEKESP